MRALLPLLFICFFSSVKANTTDSLLDVWQNVNVEPKSRTEAFQTYIWEHLLTSNPDSAKSAAWDLMRFSRTNDLPSSVAFANKIVGLCYKSEGNFDSSLFHLNKALDQFTALKDSQSVGGVCLNIGTVYKDQGNLKSSLNYYSQAQNCLSYSRNTLLQAHALQSIGNIYVELEEYAQAKTHYVEAQTLYQAIGDERNLAKILHNQANISLNKEDYAEAKRLLLQSKRLKEKLDDSASMNRTLHNLGTAYRNLDALDSAEFYYLGSIELSEIFEDRWMLSTSLTDLGSIFQLQGQVRKALQLCKRSLDIADSIEVPEKQLEACNCLYEIYSEKQDYRSALRYHERKAELNQQLELNEAKDAMRELEFKQARVQDSLKNEEDKLRMALSHESEIHKKNRNRNLLIGGGVLFLIAAISLWSRLRYVRQSRTQIALERDKSDSLLLNILPESVADELKAKGETTARNFQQASILFTDFKDFTKQSESLTPKQVIEELNICFKEFDRICELYRIEKIKTIGDSFMAAGGLENHDSDSCERTVLAALEMMKFVTERKGDSSGGLPRFLEMRAGINTGPVVAGVVGSKKFQYDIWGDTVNTASRMETNGQIGRVNVSQSVFDLLKDNDKFTFTNRGLSFVKGKGDVQMYFVDLR